MDCGKSKKKENPKGKKWHSERQEKKFDQVDNEYDYEDL